MSKANNSIEVLIAMKWMLENIGWTQHTFFRSKEGFTIETVDPTTELMPTIASMCLRGASILVEASYEVKLEADKRLSEDLLDDDLIVFNDAPGRTKEQVIALIDKAIKG